LERERDKRERERDKRERERDKSWRLQLYVHIHEALSY
jgi:hypothetical protein